MTEPTDQPSAGPHASPAAATRREARLLRESQEAASLRGPQLAAPLAAPLAPAGATLADTLALPVAAPIEPAVPGKAAPGNAASRRRVALWVSGAAVVLCLGLGAAGLWLPRTPGDAAAGGQDISALGDPDPRTQGGFEGGGSPTPAGPTSPAAPPSTTPPPVETVAAPAPDAPAPDGDPGSLPPQSIPAPDAPGTPAPAPAPAPAPPQAAAAPAPLAFTGVTPNQTVGLLGIRILSSYTLSLSGQPRSTASVTYGGAPAGSVTFDGSGRASITVGAGALDLGIGNPMITAAYADGTAGEPIQARRNSI
ncbi:hypothetical protein [Microbacterium sp. 2MCAF23]|uniref:hypothetical protein n=1 Tax=Microbacterium sp. 2MCAF23 TaxID=3232985 RepID=UPI003F952B82